MFHFFSKIQNRISFKFIYYIKLLIQTIHKGGGLFWSYPKADTLKLDPRRFFTPDSKKVNTANCNSKKKMDLSWNVHDIQNLPRCALFPPLWSMEDMNEVDKGEIIFKQQIVVNF